MKKLIVILFFFVFLFSEWQQSGEIALPKGLRINDLTINSIGEVWLLSPSSILKVDPTSKNAILIHELKDVRFFSVLNDEIYLVNSNHRLSTINLKRQDIIEESHSVFNTPLQICAISVENRPMIMVLESNRLLFMAEEKTLGTISSDINRFSVIPLADYSDVQTPFFTLFNNRVYAWTGGNYNAIEKYQRRIIYSASNNILDFSADRNGNLYILFSDSIIVLDNKGEYKSKIKSDNLPPDSKILINPANNNIIVYNAIEKELRVLSEAKKETGEIIVLNKNHPNPVDNYTEIEFTIKESLNLTLTIYNLIGEPVKVVARGYFSSGAHRIVWQADDEKGSLVPNGVYFYRLESKKGVAIRQLIVLR